MNWLFGTFFVCLAVSAGSMVIMQIRTKRKSEKAFAIEKTKAKDDKNARRDMIQILKRINIYDDKVEFVLDGKIKIAKRGVKNGT